MSSSDPYHLPHTPLLIVISGPSGAGKDTLLARLREQGHAFHFVVTSTTRARRPEEVDGRDYHFVSRLEFETMLARDELLEHALVYGDYKGIPKQQVHQALASGQDVILRLDVQGAATIRRLAPGAVLIFLTAGDEAELVGRLRERRTETADRLQVRLDTAREELKHLEAFDYVVVNRDSAIDRAVADVISIIHAEHCRVRPRQVTL